MVIWQKQKKDFDAKVAKNRKGRKERRKADADIMPAGTVHCGAIPLPVEASLISRHLDVQGRAAVAAGMEVYGRQSV